ncbi:hypothetical protein VTI74DRAFT_867 [Chaetomium olivicolor]
MTEVVAEAERRGELPHPDLSPGNFASARRHPTIPELQTAFAVSLLAKGIAHVFLAMTTSPPPERQIDYSVHWSECMPQQEEHMPEWNSRIHKAIYRILIAGAALAGASMFSARAEADLGLGLARTLIDSPRSSSVSWSGLLLGDWLLEDILSHKDARDAMAQRFQEGYGRALYFPSRDDYPVTDVCGGNHADAHLVTWEMMQMRWAHKPVHEALARNPSVDATISPVAEPSDGSEGRQPNCNVLGETGSHVVPLALKFFEYFLRLHLRLRFAPVAFHYYREPGYDECLKHVAILCHDDVEERPEYEGPYTEVAGFLNGIEILEPFDPHPIRVFKPPDKWWLKPAA